MAFSMLSGATGAGSGSCPYLGKIAAERMLGKTQNSKALRNHALRSHSTVGNGGPPAANGWAVKLNLAEPSSLFSNTFFGTNDLHSFRELFPNAFFELNRFV